jgi:hypothetical protein
MIDVGPYRWQNIPTIFRTQSSRASRLFCLVCAQPYHAVPNSCHRCTLGQPLRMVLGHSVTVRRGAYRQPGQGLDEAYVVLPKELRYNPGAKSVKVLAGVAVGRVRMWHVLEQKWSGRAAAAVYAGPVINALQRTWPGKRVFHVLEDNDPTGFKSGRGEAAKKTAGIKAFVIPKRSPDLNVCDYALWSAVNRKMRRQELSFPRAKREARSEYVLRLRRAAQSLSRSFVERSIGDMKRRCQLLYARRGGLFEEGGRRCMS